MLFLSQRFLVILFFFIFDLVLGEGDELVFRELTEGACGVDFSPCVDATSAKHMAAQKCGCGQLTMTKFS
jgi:hypothetical protein